jgi:hypothetical protein
MMNFFLFQMAMLAESMSKILLGKMAALPKMLKTTYTRSTIKREAPATARYPKNYKREREKRTDYSSDLAYPGPGSRIGR